MNLYASLMVLPHLCKASHNFGKELQQEIDGINNQISDMKKRQIPWAMNRVSHSGIAGYAQFHDAGFVD